MGSDNTFKLIDGHFAVEEAEEVLFNLFQSKIKFHNAVIFSVQQRTGTDPLPIHKRVEELTAEFKEIKQLLELAKACGCQVDVQGTIQITLTS